MRNNNIDKGTMSHDAGVLFDDVKSYADKSIHNIERGLQETSELGVDLIEKMYNSTKSALGSASEKFMEGYEKAYGQMKHTSEEVGDMIKRHPVATAFAVAGIGIVIGRYLIPSHRKIIDN
ncbi:MAG: hypothetical protein KA116_00050 [Proteobacteria bacterium]|nr:hypothetical protein [Pseudomonadota bacterium]